MSNPGGRYTPERKDILHMNDNDFNMDEIIEDVTRETIKHINKTPELYQDVKFGRYKDKAVTEDSVRDTCIAYAKAHNNEFGPLFQTELDMVDWKKVIAIV